ncbi:MAG TPA: prephenate dehydratase domain-containing protein, partial [Patescibacteria group bacterium]|nr:prephenate dehydratase domain-containing protein [Patescibacteria group bacterium]
MTIKIGVSGNRGSFSEEAAQYYCQEEKIEDFDLSYLENVSNVLESLSKKDIDRGIFPIENSNGGIVYEAVQAMSKYKFQIDKIFEIDIKMNLLVGPGVNAQQIRQIVSHPQALKQCRMYLKRRWPETELKEYSDTAGAARDLSQGVLPPDSAVISPRICAELY